MQQNKNSLTANEIRVYLEGKPVGLIKSISVRTQYGLVPITEIGSIDPKEWVATLAQSSLEISSMGFKENALENSGLVPKESSDALLGYVFDILIVNQQTGKRIIKIWGASCDNVSWQIQANQPISYSGSFKALKVTR